MHLPLHSDSHPRLHVRIIHFLLIRMHPPDLFFGNVGMKIVRITREAATADELEQKSGHRISIWNPWNAKIIIVNLIPSYA